MSLLAHEVEFRIGFLVTVEAILLLLKRLQCGIRQSVAARSEAPDRADQQVIPTYIVYRKHPDNAAVDRNDLRVFFASF